MTGRVVILNGTSSAGKTTLSRAFAAERVARGECWICLGLDEFTSLLPPEWMDLPMWTGAHGEDGFRFVPSEEGLVVAVGDVGRRLYAAYRRNMAVFARQGFDVLVDEVVIDEETARDWDIALADLPVLWVAVHCDPEIAEARERERGDRFSGLARGLADVVHRYRTYDLELDAGVEEAPALATKLSAFVDAWHPETR